MNAITSNIEWTAWRRVRVHVGGVVGSSFQAAVVATTLFFVLVDPLALAAAAHQPWLQNRLTAYCAGVLLFWAATTLSAALLSCVSNTSARTHDG